MPQLNQIHGCDKTLGASDIYQLAPTKWPYCPLLYTDGRQVYHCPPLTAEVLDRDEGKLLSPSTLVHLTLKDADDLSGVFAGGGGRV